jgi:hypothetical protein
LELNGQRISGINRGLKSDARHPDAGGISCLKQNFEPAE